jgi:hypothetical protein
VPQGTELAGGELARFRDQKSRIDALLGDKTRALAAADTGGAARLRQ